MGALLDWAQLPTERLLLVYRLLENAMFCMSAVLVILTLYVMQQAKTTSVSRYRLYLVNELVWSFVMDATLSLVTPVVLLPVPCYYASNLLAAQPTAVQRFFFFLGCTATVGKLLSLVFLFAYRLSRALPVHATQAVFRLLQHVTNKVSPEFMFLRFAAFLVCLCTLIFVPLTIFTKEADKQKRLIVSIDPDYALLFSAQPQTVCYGRSADGRPYILAPAMCVLFMPPCLLAALWLIHRYLGEMRRLSRSAPTAYRLQIMLLRSLIAQVSVTFLTLLLPAWVVLVLPFFTPRNTSTLSALSFMVITVHTPADCLMILCFIRPYRRFLLDRMPRLSTNNWPFAGWSAGRCGRWGATAARAQRSHRSSERNTVCSEKPETRF